jgi:hypothetical protein
MSAESLLVLLSLNFFAGCGELVALAILSPAIWLRRCCFVGQPILAAAAFQAAT